MINILQRNKVGAAGAGGWRGQTLDDEGQAGGQAEDDRHYDTTQTDPLLTSK